MNTLIYVRVSTDDQDYTRQIDDLKQLASSRNWQIVDIIAEKVSGSKTGRLGVERLLQAASGGNIDKVLVSEVSRLGRNTLDVLTTVNKLTEMKVSVFINSYQIETLLPDGKSNAMASFMLTILAEFATMERTQHLERVNSGLQKAKKDGRILGRPTGSIKTNSDLLEEYKPVVKLLNQGFSARKVAKLSDVSINTVLKVKNAQI